MAADATKPTMTMLSEKQADQLKKLGMWREPVIRPDNWMEELLHQSLVEAKKQLENTTPKEKPVSRDSTQMSLVEGDE